LHPEEFRQWQAVFRDVLIVLIGAFMLLFETVRAPEPNPYVIGAGLIALGVPPALRTDERLRRSRPTDDEEEAMSERWSHLR
jgi:hypothetical protein